MLPAVLEEDALSLLEIQDNVKKEEGMHPPSFQAFGRRCRRAVHKKKLCNILKILDNITIIC